MDFGFFKRHPIITGAVALVCVVVFFMIFKGGGSSGTTVIAAPGADPAQTAADLQKSLMQMQLGARAQDNATALEMARIQSAAALEMGTLAAGIESTKLAAQKDVALAGIASQNAITAAELEAIRIQTSAALEQANLGFSLQSQSIAAQAEAQRQATKNAYQVAELNYYSNYMDKLRDDQNTAQLIQLLGQKAA